MHPDQVGCVSGASSIQRRPAVHGQRGADTLVADANAMRSRSSTTATSVPRTRWPGASAATARGRGQLPGRVPGDLASAARYDARVGSVRSWLLTVVHHRAIDRVRKVTRHRTQMVAATSRQLCPLPTTRAGALERVDRAEMVGLVAALPEEQRQAISLSFYSGYSNSEIGRILGIPLGTVKSRMRRASSACARAWRWRRDPVPAPGRRRPARLLRARRVQRRGRRARTRPRRAVRVVHRRARSARAGARGTAGDVEKAAPPVDLKSRVMGQVRADASLFEAARAPERPQRRLAWLRLPRVAMAVGAAAAVAARRDDRVRRLRTDRETVYAGRVDGIVAPGGHGSLTVHDGAATLKVSGLPAAGAGRMYEVWMSDRSGRARPAGVRFSVDRAGAGEGRCRRGRRRAARSWSRPRSAGTRRRRRARRSSASPPEVSRRAGSSRRRRRRRRAGG